MQSNPSSPPQISLDAAAAYCAHRSMLVSQVDRALADSPEHRALIGDNPLRMMFDNHRNHAQFLGSVMTLGRYDLLEGTIPWVYRAYLGQGFDPGYFPVELQAFREAITQHLEPEHASAVKRLYDWLEENHDRWFEAARTPPAPELVGDPRWDEARRAFFDAVISGDKRAAWDTLRDHADEVDDVIETFEEIVRPAMYEVGVRWETGQVNPAVEHRATATALMTLAALQMHRQPNTSFRGRAVVTAAPDEFHELGGHIVAMALEEDGWQVGYLGANTPTEDLLELVREVQPQVLAISISMAYNLDAAAETIARLRDDPDCARTRVMIGGLAFRSMPELALSLGADAAPGALRDAVQSAREWGD